MFHQAVVQDHTCSGQCDGSNLLSPSGGVAPYVILWDPVPPNGQGSMSATGLCAGDHTVHVIDANGCSVSTIYTITEPVQLSVTTASTASTCPLCDGTASVTIAGGTAPYVVNWTFNNVPVGSGEVLTDLCGGLYIATVSDASGCAAQVVVAVQDSNAEVLTPVDGQVRCSTDCNGIAEVQFTCSAPPCTVLWADALGNTIAQDVSVVDSLCIGDYLVQVTNANGCVSIDTVSVTPGQYLNVSLSSSSATCAGLCDGTATVGAMRSRW